jgi:hypothetical protein
MGIAASAGVGLAGATGFGSPKSPTVVTGGGAGARWRAVQTTSAPRPRPPRPTPTSMARTVAGDGPVIGSSILSCERSPCSDDMAGVVSADGRAMRSAPHWLQNREPAGFGAEHPGQVIAVTLADPADADNGAAPSHRTEQRPR